MRLAWLLKGLLLGDGAAASPLQVRVELNQQWGSGCCQCYCWHYGKPGGGGCCGVDKPALTLRVPSCPLRQHCKTCSLCPFPPARSYNIWHTWNEGLMGLFQTLREQGALPLVQVDGEGNMR